jgi:hypothetical protein
MDDEVLPRLAPLVGVVLAGEEEGVLDARALDLDGGVLGVLLDDGEEVAEEPALMLRAAAGCGSVRGSEAMHQGYFRRQRSIGEKTECPVVRVRAQ